uniref:Claudin n=1 Tax=Varanus komodoensis TaxID=61221 RepID=A0A8D2ISS4_VARKO
MSVILELTGFVFTLSGWVIVGATLSNSYWKVSTSFGNVITSTAVYENLWQSCATDSMGISDCKEFGTLLALPGMFFFIWNLIGTAIKHIWWASARGRLLCICRLSCNRKD